MTESVGPPTEEATSSSASSATGVGSATGTATAGTATADGLPAGGRRGGRATGANAVWLTLERIIHMAVAFVVTIVVARLLGPTDYGRIAVSLALLTLLLPISNIAAQCLVRDVVSESKSANALYSAAQVASGLITTGIVLIVFIVTFATVGIGSSTGIVTLVIIGSALLRPLQVVDAWFLIRLNSRRTVLIRIAALLLSGVLRVGLPLLGFGVVVLAWTYVLEAVLGAFGTYLAYRRAESGYHWELSWDRVQRLLRELAPLLLASSSALIFMRLDQLMLAALSNLAEAGVFAAASSLAETPRFPLVALMSSLAPALVAAKQVDEQRYRESLQAVSRLVTMLGYIITVGLIAVVAPLAPILLGGAYGDTWLVIVILALGTPLACVGGVLLYVTNWEKLYREAVIRNLVAAAISVGLNFILLPRYGAIGAAITTLVATLWVYVLGSAFAERTRPIFWLTLPSLEPVSSIRGLLAFRRERAAREADAADQPAFDEQWGSSL